MQYKLNTNETFLVTSGNTSVDVFGLGSSKQDKLTSAGSSTMPVYINNSGVPTAISSLAEAYLSFGGKNFSASYGPIDAAMVPELGANRLAFIPAAAITVEYSRDSGQTWTNYGLTDAEKINLFNGNGASAIIGKASTSSYATNQYLLRIRLTGSNKGATTNSLSGLYSVLNKFVIFVSTNGSNGNWCTIKVRTKTNYDSDVDSWSTIVNQTSIAGWSGYNVINHPNGITFGYNPAQIAQIDFIFGCTTGPTSGNYPGLNVVKIFGFGGMGWSTPSTLAKNGHLYYWDSAKNAAFPAKVTATGFIKSGGTSSQYLKADGSVSTLTFDTTPTSGSSNPITSGGVYDALGNIESLLAAI